MGLDFKLLGQGEAVQPPSPTLPANPWPASSAGITGGGEQTQIRAGALLQLAVAEGVKLNVARQLGKG